PARLQWSDWSRQCPWPAQSCEYRPAPAKSPGPAPRISNCHTAAQALRYPSTAPPAAAPPAESRQPRAETPAGNRSDPEALPGPPPPPGPQPGHYAARAGTSPPPETPAPPK